VEKKKVYRKKYLSLLILIMISISILFRLYHAQQKKIYHIDELFSFQIINTTLYDREKHQKFAGKWIAGSKYINYYFTIEKQKFKRDLKFLLKNTKDSAHPNL
jgi:hypothetical protein